MCNHPLQLDDVIITLSVVVQHVVNLQRLSVWNRKVPAPQPTFLSKPSSISIEVVATDAVYVEDDIVDLLGGPIEIPIVEREELVVPETPPPQEVMERLRTPIIEEDVCAVDREVDLLVREGRALPEYEDAPDYVDVLLYKES